MATHRKIPGERGSGAQTGEAFGGNCFAAYGNVYGIDPGGSICTLSEDRHGGGGGHDLSDPGGKVSAGGERKVWKHLKAGNPEAAREAVSMIVGRDTQNLTEEGVAKGAIETVAENTSDGVIAPMLYTALGGRCLVLYKAVNTMDSMVGYKNDRYLHFGRAAAKLDDVVNFFPARISAFLMIGAAFLSGKSYNGRQAWRIWRRDSRKHASPNSARRNPYVPAHWEYSWQEMPVTLAKS